MDFKAMELMRRLRDPNKQRDTGLVVESNPTDVTPPGGQPANATGLPSSGSPSLAALSSFTTPPPQSLDAAQPLEQSFGTENPASTPSGGPSKLAAILKARGVSKQNFLGG